MKRRLPAVGTMLLLVALISSPSSVLSQTKISIGADFVYPTSDFGDVAGGGFGFNVGIAYPMSERADFIGEIGFNAYGGVTLGVAEVQWYGMPVAAGARLFANEMFFVQAKGGLIYKTGEAKAAGVTTDQSETGWLVSPGVGVDLGKVGIVAEYGVSNDSWQWFGLKASYQFGK